MASIWRYCNATHVGQLAVGHDRRADVIVVLGRRVEVAVVGCVAVCRLTVAQSVALNGRIGARGGRRVAGRVGRSLLVEGRIGSVVVVADLVENAVA